MAGGVACRRMKLKRNYHFMQYDDHAKGAVASSPAHADRGPPDRLLSGTPFSVSLSMRAWLVTNLGNFAFQIYGIKPQLTSCLGILHKIQPYIMPWITMSLGPVSLV